MLQLPPVPQAPNFGQTFRWFADLWEASAMPCLSPVKHVSLVGCVCIAQSLLASCRAATFRDPGDTNHLTLVLNTTLQSCRVVVRGSGSTVTWVFNQEYFWYPQGDDSGEAESQHLDLCRSSQRVATNPNTVGSTGCTREMIGAPCV